MNLLAIDSSCSILCAAVLKNEEFYFSEIEGVMTRSEFIMDCIDKVMVKASLKPNDLNGVLCMKGPGSFTGLRIGYSTAKGLALSLSIPFAPVPTLDCVARGILEKSLQDSSYHALSIVNASKNSFFYAFYRVNQNSSPSITRLTQDRDGDINKIIEDIKQYQEKLIITGPGTALAGKLLPENIKNACVIFDETRAYAKELITIAKYTKILDNDVAAFLYSGPEYNRLPG